MGIFGGRRKAEQEEAERRERAELAEAQRLADEREEQFRQKQKGPSNAQRVMAWFESLEQHCPENDGLLTDEILLAVGPFPHPAEKPGTQSSRAAILADWAGLKSAGRMAAGHFEAQAIAGQKPNAAYWTSVREYCDGILN